MFAVGDDEFVQEDVPLTDSRLQDNNRSDRPAFSAFNDFSDGFMSEDLADFEMSTRDLVYTERKKEPKIYGRYIFGEKIGEGSFGKVKEVLDLINLRRYAVKIVKYKKIRKMPNGPENLRKEIMLLRRLKHPNVIRIVDTLYNHVKEKIYVFMEYCHGNVQGMLDHAPDKRIPVWQAHLYFGQLLEALKYIHSQGVLHRDIKPENMLLMADDTLKLADFGVANVLSRFSPSTMVDTSEGTPFFQCPEVAGGLMKFDGVKADVWATGVTLYNMITGLYPFNSSHIMKLYQLICEGQYKVPEHVPADAAQLISHMLDVDPDIRYSLEQISAHRFVRDQPIQEDFRVPLPVDIHNPQHSSSIVPILDDLYAGEDMYSEASGDELGQGDDEFVAINDPRTHVGVPSQRPSLTSSITSPSTSPGQTRKTSITQTTSPPMPRRSQSHSGGVFRRFLSSLFPDRSASETSERSAMSAPAPLQATDRSQSTPNVATAASGASRFSQRSSKEPSVSRIGEFDLSSSYDPSLHPLLHLPVDLPEPVDDGACDHLLGMEMPSTTLLSTTGRSVNLSKVLGRWVLFIHPMLGNPATELPDGWDAVPGARGCTPQSCGFRDNYRPLLELTRHVYGMSSQSHDDQCEVSERLGLPYQLLSDDNMELKMALNLPTFELNGKSYYKRVTLIVQDGVVAAVFYPIFPPDRNAKDVLDWLELHRADKATERPAAS
eukprot:m.236687 g.236687  ORF g.236687 m.236687 type:complete len:717 (+) comp17415_c0_seq9:41-2191(+)